MKRRALGRQLDVDGAPVGVGARSAEKVRSGIVGLVQQPAAVLVVEVDQAAAGPARA